MDEDEKLKGQSPHVAYVCSQIGKFALSLRWKFAFVIKLRNLEAITLQRV